MTLANRRWYIEKKLGDFGIRTIDGKPIAQVLSQDQTCSLHHYFDTHLTPRINGMAYDYLYKIFEFMIMDFMPASRISELFEKLPMEQKIAFLTKKVVDEPKQRSLILSRATEYQDYHTLKELDLCWRKLSKDHEFLQMDLHYQLYFALDELLRFGVTRNEASFENADAMIADVNREDNIGYRQRCLMQLMNMAAHSAVYISGTSADPTKLRFLLKIDKTKFPTRYDFSDSMELVDVYALICSELVLKQGPRAETLEFFTNAIYNQFDWSDKEFYAFKHKVKSHLDNTRLYDVDIDSVLKLKKRDAVLDDSLIEILKNSENGPYPIKNVDRGVEVVEVSIPDEFTKILSELDNLKQKVQEQYARSEGNECEDAYSLLKTTYNNLFDNGKVFFSSKKSSEEVAAFIQKCTEEKNNAITQATMSIKNAIEKLLQQKQIDLQVITEPSNHKIDINVAKENSEPVGTQQQIGSNDDVMPALMDVDDTNSESSKASNDSIVPEEKPKPAEKDAQIEDHTNTQVTLEASSELPKEMEPKNATIVTEPVVQPSRDIVLDQESTPKSQTPAVPAYVPANTSLEQGVKSRLLPKEGLEKHKEYFIKRLEKIKIETDILIDKGTLGSDKYDSEYSKVGPQAKYLYERLKEAADALYTAENPTEQDFNAFKSTCKGAIDAVEPEFKNHRGKWGKLPRILRIFLGFFVLPISVFMPNTFFGKPDTKSKQLLDTFQKDLQQQDEELDRIIPK